MGDTHFGLLIGEFTMSLYNLRREYRLHELDLNDLAVNPIDQFKIWMDQAKAIVDPNIPWYEPTTIMLATCDGQGVPHARVLLLKGFDDAGFVFFTNYDSNKGKQIAQNSNATMVIHWAPLERQVRVTGTLEKISTEASRKYFDSRPRGSQLGAAASAQSQVVANRKLLDDQVEELDKAYQTKKIPMPRNWGGYRLKPTAIEFWQGRPNRMHDRLLYTRKENTNWVISRLAP